MAHLEGGPVPRAWNFRAISEPQSNTSGTSVIQCITSAADKHKANPAEFRYTATSAAETG